MDTLLDLITFVGVLAAMWWCWFCFMRGWFILGVIWPFFVVILIWAVFV